MIARRKFHILSGTMAARRLQPEAPPAPSIIFEDDFETGDLSNWTSTNIDSGTTLTVVSTGTPHGGSEHAQFTSDGTADAEGYMTKTLADLTEVYFEIWIKPSSFAALNDFQAPNVIQLRDGGTLALQIGLQTDGANGIRPLLIDGSGLLWGASESFSLVPQDVYKKYEIHWRADSGGGDGIITFTYDDVVRFNITNDSNSTGLAIDTLHIGCKSSDGSTEEAAAGSELYFDDASLDDEALS